MGGGKGPNETRLQTTAAGIAAGLVAAVALLTFSGSRASARPMLPKVAVPMISKSVMEAQALVKKSPEAARKKILNVYYQTGFSSGAEYAAASSIMATGQQSDEQILAHDLAVAAIALGDRSALPIVAQTEDGFLRASGLDERFEAEGDWQLPISAKHRALFFQSQGPMTEPLPSPS